MKRKNVSDEISATKSKATFLQTIPESIYYKALIKLYSNIVYICVFLESKVHPRNDDGDPEYSIPLSSLTHDCFDDIPLLSLIPDVSFLVNPELEIKLQNSSQDTAKITVVIKPSISTSKPLPKSSILKSQKKVETTLKNYINKHSQKWKLVLKQSSAKFAESKLPKTNVLSDNVFDPPSFIEEVKSSKFYKDQIVENGVMLIPKKPAIYSKVQGLLNENTIRALAKYWEISPDDVRLYQHQAVALQHIQNGHSVVVATSTSSGKSLIYQIPVLTSIYDSYMDPSTETKPTALFLFPTKALAQDQLISFKRLSSHFCQNAFFSVGTFDGDTSYEDRDQLQQTGDVLFSNPDIIHTTILPKWKDWERFLKRLKFIIIDELHTYSGMFGVNVVFTFRRLKRICNEIGNHNIQIISCSATINQPENILKSFFALDDNEIRLVGPEYDGSPAGDRSLVVWNSPIVNPASQPYNRAHPIHDATHLFVELLLKGSRILAFCKIRRSCELMLKAVNDELDRRKLNQLKSRVMSYRGGYSIADRRQIESRMFNGELSGIIATNALELGIDIGFLDAVLIVGFPFSIANFRQQSGRSGRRENSSLTVLIGGSDPIDQHYMEHPTDIIHEKVPDTVLNLQNDDILVSHLQCAAYEMPLAIETDCEYFDVFKDLDSELDLKENAELFSDIVKKELTPILEEEGFVFYGPATEYMPYPASTFSLRNIGKGDADDEHTFAVIDITKNAAVVIERLEDERVPFTLYQGAIYLFQGVTYLVESIDVPKRYALVKEIKANYITKSRDYVDVDPYRTVKAKELDCFDTTGHQNASASCGLVNENAYIFGYYKFGKGKSGGYSRIIESVEIAESQKHMFWFQAPGFWINLPSGIMRILSSKKLSLAASIHAVEHAVLSLVPLLFLNSDPSKLFTECKAPAKEFKTGIIQRKRPARLIFYESINKTIATKEIKQASINSTGIMKKIYERLPELLELACNRVEECKNCVWGCLSCVASTYCREESIVISKPGAILILRFLCNRSLDADSVLNGPEENLKNTENGDTIAY